MTNEPIGIVILILTLLVFAGIFLWALVWGRRPQLPEGHRIEGKWRQYRVIMVFEKYTSGLLLDELAIRSAIALGCVLDDMKKTEKTVCIYVPTDNTFDAYGFKGVKNAAAFLIRAKASVGKGIPMMVVRNRHLGQIYNKGEPIIHEAIHLALGQYSAEGVDRDHSHFNAWVANAGEHSTQAHARRQFLDNITKRD